MRRRTPRQQRSRDTVGFVLTAAAQVFEREGIAATTNRIAERAGVSIGTLYQYFPDKLALLYALAERHVREADAALEATYARARALGLAPADALAEIVETVVDRHAGQPTLHVVLERFTPRLPEGVAVVEALRERCATEVAHHLARAEPDLAAEELLSRARAAVHAVDAQVHRMPLADRDEQVRRLTATGAAVLGLAAPTITP